MGLGPRNLSDCGLVQITQKLILTGLRTFRAGHTAPNHGKHRCCPSFPPLKRFLQLVSPTGTASTCKNKKSREKARNPLRIHKLCKDQLAESRGITRKPACHCGFSRPAPVVIRHLISKSLNRLPRFPAIAWRLVVMMPCSQAFCLGVLTFRPFYEGASSVIFGKMQDSPLPAWRAPLDEEPAQAHVETEVGFSELPTPSFLHSYASCVRFLSVSKPLLCN